MSDSLKLTDITSISEEFTHPAHFQAYLKEFQAAFKQGKFQAVTGAVLQIKVRKSVISCPSYVVLYDQRFREWHTTAAENARNLSYDGSRVVRAEQFKDVTPEMFALLADQARQQQSAPTPAKLPNPPATEKPQLPAKTPAPVKTPDHKQGADQPRGAV